jgi:hypothetical protein
VEVKNHVVVLRPGPVVQNSFDRTEISYNWELHVIGGLARRHAKEKIEDLEWQKDPVLTVYVGGDIDLDKIEVPNGLTLRGAPGRSDDAKENTAAKGKIAEFLEVRKIAPQK